MLDNIIRIFQPSIVSKKKTVAFSLDKRQKFVISVLLLSLLFFTIQLQIGKVGIPIILLISVLTDVLLYWAMRKDLSEHMIFSIFILPFFFSLAFGLFYFLIPTRILFRVILTVLYSFGLYSLFLSQNIFVVAAIRTIALLTGARIVSFVITLLCFIFLTNIVLSFHFSIFITVALILFFTFTLAYHALWTYALQKTPYPLWWWAGGVSICIAEVATLLLFWPSNPTVLSLFLSSIFYVFIGLSHVWMEKRLFRNVLWEYVWVSMLAFLFLQLFTQWGK